MTICLRSRRPKRSEAFLTPTVGGCHVAPAAPPSVAKKTSSLGGSSMMQQRPQLDVHVSVAELPRMDVGSPSDPFVVAYALEVGSPALLCAPHN